jgi:hypothetical protein
MFPLILALAHLQTTDFSVKPDQGLNLSVAGVPIVRGSWIQYYESDWSRAYFSSVNSTQTVKTLSNGDVVLMFRSQDGKAYGTELYSPLPDGVKVTYTFGWTGDRPVNVELTAGALWTDPLQHGTLSADGKYTRSLSPETYTSDEIKPRSYAIGAKEFVFTIPAGTLTFRGLSSTWTCFDARNLNKGWARDKSLLWLGSLALQVKPNDVTTSEAEWHFAPKAASTQVSGPVQLNVQSLPNALQPHDNDFPVIPTPKQEKLNKDDPMEFTDSIDIDPTQYVPSLEQDLKDAINARWDIPKLKIRQPELAHVFFRVQNLALPPESYEIQINRKTAMIMGQDPDGIRRAIATLGQLFFAKDGKLCLPSGIIRDWPSTSWRGVHLFVGPDANDFHAKLWQRVLLPLKFNKVVLECERTAWRALPNPKPADYMSRTDLQNLFSYYREIGVEPIPLIQSFGHMDWLFPSNQKSELAIFPDSPTCIDPRSDKGKELLTKVWDEAITLLHPRAVHFGLDEVDNKWPTNDPGLMTQLWQMQLPYLANIAEQHKVGMMCWGDQCLAPGEAIDAALGDSKQDAMRRRQVLPKGSFVTDWHYKNDPDPTHFTGSLALWKSEGLQPIAATWFRPENIRGFYLAAIEQGVGTLQTTWVGKTSNEDSMLHEFRQFAAMVVAADYAWSGRKDDWDKLGYDPFDVFSKMYFSPPSKLTPTPGMSASIPGGVEARIGDVQFKCFEPISLRSLLTAQTAQLSQDLTVETSGLKGTELALALDTTVPSEDDKPVAEVDVELVSGQVIKQDLVYGRDLRATADTKPNSISPRNGGLSCVRISLGTDPVEIKQIVFRGNSTYAGLRLHGVTAF